MSIFIFQLQNGTKGIKPSHLWRFLMLVSLNFYVVYVHFSREPFWGQDQICLEIKLRWTAGKSWYKLELRREKTLGEQTAHRHGTASPELEPPSSSPASWICMILADLIHASWKWTLTASEWHYLANGYQLSAWAHSPEDRDLQGQSLSIRSQEENRD